MTYEEEKAEDLKRLKKMNREDLVREYVDMMTAQEQFTICFEYIYAEDTEYTDEKMIKVLNSEGELDIDDV